MVVFFWGRRRPCRIDGRGLARSPRRVASTRPREGRSRRGVLRAPLTELIFVRQLRARRADAADHGGQHHEGIKRASRPAPRARNSRRARRASSPPRRFRSVPERRVRVSRPTRATERKYRPRWDGSRASWSGARAAREPRRFPGAGTGWEGGSAKASEQRLPLLRAHGQSV